MLWIKTFHLLFVMAWMAGLFYFPRILVHHVEGHDAGEDVRRLVIMADRLFRFMTLMAMLAVILGSWLWFSYFPWFAYPWLNAKLAFVLMLVLYHYQCYRFFVQMRRNERPHTGVFFRVFNESALLIAIPILILVIVKPF